MLPRRLLFADSLRNQAFTLKTPVPRSMSEIEIYQQLPKPEQFGWLSEVVSG
jgi:hypothetical protein